MEYRDEFETRKDVFRVNVFHNKKNGEKVTMYFVPRSTPVNEDTVFDYCTKNKTWREKQAQQWCDEKIGKNKDKLKSLPFVAGGLQRDLKWFGDKATALFDDYKKGLGMTVQPKNNNQTGGNQGFQDKLKSLASLGEKEIVQKFNELFKAGGDNWRTSDAGHNAYGEALMNAELTIKGKGGQSKTYKTKAGSGIEPAVGKRAAQRNVILAFLAEEYGIGQKKEKPRADLEGFKDYIRENLRDEDCRREVIEIAKQFGLQASYENYDPRAKIGKYQGNGISLHIGDGESFPHTYRGLGQSRNDAENAAALRMAKELCGLDVKEAVLNDEIRYAEDSGHSEDLKYLHVLDERPDVAFHDNIFANYYIDTPYGKQPFFNDGIDGCDACYYVLNNLDVSREAIRKVKVSEQEKEEINQQIDIDKKHFIAKLEKQAAAEKAAEEKRKAELEKAETERRVRELIEQRKREEFERLNFEVIEKSTDNKEHRAYVIQDDKGEQYKLTVDYGDVKIVDREHHPDWDRYDYGYKTAKVEHQHFEKPMRTLTVAYEKIGGKEDEKFALSAAVEPEVFAMNPLSIDLVFGANLNQTITQKQNKDNALFLRKLLKESKDPINASPKKFKEQQTFKGR